MYEEETYDAILGRVLSRIPDTFDKRESSFLYNASAPMAVELQNAYIAMGNLADLMYFDTTDREGKLQRCKERGIDLAQFAATCAVSMLETLPSTVEVPVGSRLNYNAINFIVTEKVEAGKYRVECETEGVIGNVTGVVIPVDYIEGLESSEITEISQWGEDEAPESIIDDVYYASIGSQAFGGNRADYIEKMKKIPGVGGVKVYTASEWNGGGTVKLVFTTSSFTKPSDDFVDSVQTIIDPVQNSGAGYGIAPAGHTVTVAGVSESVIDISAVLTLQNGYVWEDVSDYVAAAIDTYFQELNESWDREKSLVVRVSQIETRILGVTGILDITGTALNGSESNLSLDKDAIAKRGSVMNAVS